MKFEDEKGTILNPSSILQIEIATILPSIQEIVSIITTKYRR